jgi:RND family efflux transporter MFP subunit
MEGLPFSKVAAVTACALLAACAEESAERAPAVTRAMQADAGVGAIVEPLQFENVRTRVEAVGTSRALRSIELHPATSGEVTAVNFEPGQRVSRGDVLVKLDDRDERLAMQLAKVRLEDAERLYDRYQRSADSGAVLPTTIDAARTAVESARIELERAEVALDYRTIEALFDGYVGITEVDPGDRVNPDTLITTLDDRSALLVSFEVPESITGDLEVGDEVEVATWSSRSPTAFGEVVDIGSRIDPATRTFVARARVGNEADALRPGMSFRVSLNLEGTPYPVVAETGVQWGADGAYIWSVVDGKARRVPVSVIQRQQGQVLVDGSLQEGDLIVVEGIQRLREGVDVNFEPTGLADRIIEDAGHSGSAMPANAD